MPERIRVAWVDNCQLTRECMTIALSRGTSPIIAAPFDDVRGLVEQTDKPGIDLIVLHAHSMDAQIPHDIAALRAADFVQPIILVTGDEAADQIANVKNSLRLGASGHLSTQTTGIDLAISSFAFAHQGGTFAPMNLLLAVEQAVQKTGVSRATGTTGTRITPPTDLPLAEGQTIANPVAKTRARHGGRHGDKGNAAPRLQFQRSGD